jgi:hypothetical protein
MIRILIFPLVILFSAAVVDAEIYSWTDDQGVVTFTDNPARIPSRYSSSAQKGEDNIIRIPKVRKESRKPVGKRAQAAIPHNRARSVAAAKAAQKSVPLENQAEIKGHLGGDQTDPAPPSMKQPKPVAPGDQPIPEPAGKQPKSEPAGKQPKPAPAGMKQPAPDPLGDQPTPAALGMEQPEPKQ